MFLQTIRLMCRLLVRIWAAPWTLFGAGLGLLGLLLGTKMQWRRGVMEFHGGLVRWLLKWCAGGASGMTLGHVILGTDAAALDKVRDHEHVHVRQYERWGLLFIPAYLLSSAYLYCRGRDGYMENPFEKEAYALFDPSGRMQSRPVKDPKG